MDRSQPRTPRTGGSPSLLRRLNSAAVLHAIRDGGPISRAELARRVGISKPTVNEAVELLLRAGYVTEARADGETRPRRPGPRARLLEFRGDLGHVLGIDIGANKLVTLVTDLNGSVVGRERRRVRAAERRSADAMLGAVRAAAAAALDDAGVERRGLKAVGVGTPGVVDPASGRVSLAPQLGGWEGLQLGSRLRRSFPDCPILVDNEVHLSVLAERWLGAARGIDDAFFVQIGVGIGGGILIGGQLYRGAAGAAGEIGYLPLEATEEGHDGLGPFEAAAGGTAFARLGRAAAAAGGGLLARAGGDPDSIDAEVVFAAAAAGDAAARSILGELLDRLARGIAAAVVLLNPSTVILGGGIARAGERLLEPLEARIHALVPIPPLLVLSALGEDAVALGAAKLALDSVEQELFELEAVPA